MTLARLGASVSVLILAALLAGCGGGPTASGASAASTQGTAPGSFAVHMNGAMTTEVGTAHP
jgi:hypothetical protein